MKNPTIMLKKILKQLIYWLFFVDLMRVNKFKNIHKGKKIYIVGDSAELRFIDFKLLDDAPMICFNFSWLINDIYNRESPLYASLIEPFAFTPFSPLNGDIRKYLKRKISNKKLKFFTSITNRFSISGANVFYSFKQIPFDNLTKSFQKDDINFMRLSFSYALSLAIYMGSSEIHILGVSTHSNSFVEHWYSKNLNKMHRNMLVDLRNNSPLIYLINKFNFHAKIKNILISDVDDSIFEYELYFELLNSKIEYKENLEMTDLLFLHYIDKTKLYPSEDIF